MDWLIQGVTNSIDGWGYLAIFIGMALESANIPIPSEVIFGFAGYLVYLQKLDFTFSVIAGVLGGLVGSWLSYGIGYYGGKPFVLRYGRYIGLSINHLTLAEKWFDQYGTTVTFYGRLLPVIRTFISLPAGFAKMNLTHFTFYTLLGSIPWTIALIYLGQWLGQQWTLLREYGHFFSLAVACALVLLAFLYIRKRQRN